MLAAYQGQPVELSTSDEKNYISDYKHSLLNLTNNRQRRHRFPRGLKIIFDT